MYLVQRKVGFGQKERKRFNEQIQLKFQSSIYRRSSKTGFMADK